jgi:hypothetical protein
MAAPPTPPSVATSVSVPNPAQPTVPAVPVQPAASNETAAPSTAVPAVETTVVKAVETTAVPAVETTAVKAVETTAVPAVETTAIPAKPADTEVSDPIRRGADYRVNSIENFHNYEASYEINIPYNDYIVSGRRNFNE